LSCQAVFYVAFLAEKENIILPSSTYLMIFLGVIFGYGLPIWHLRAKEAGKWRFLYQYRRFLKLQNVIAGVLFFLIYAAHLANKPIIPLFLCVFILWAYMYGLNLGGRQYSLRLLFPLLKPFWVSLVWVLFLLIFPFSTILSFEKLTTYAIEFLFFLIAIYIPSEIKDKELDKKSNLRTLVMCMQENSLIYLALFFLVVAATITIMTGYWAIYLQAEIFKCVFTFAFLASLLFWENKSKNEIFYVLFLDGTIGLPFFYTFFYGIYQN
jgi:4-hydroxybenzoate polyprenyltransferase